MMGLVGLTSAVYPLSVLTVGIYIKYIEVYISRVSLWSIFSHVHYVGSSRDHPEEGAKE